MARKRFRLERSAAMLLFVAALTACAAAGGTTQNGSAPTVLRIADRAGFDGVLPPNYGGAASRLIYSCLLETGPNGDLVPDLAETVPSQANGMISKDGLTIDYHLRHNIRWQDGVPLHADDVVFTQHAVMNPQNLYPFQIPYSEVRDIIALDAYTGRVRMRHVYSPIIHKLFAQNFCFGIIPKHIFRAHKRLRDVAADANAIGSGSYRVASWKRGDRLDLTPNPFYFDGPAHVDRVVMKYVSDINTIVTEMKTGELDADFGATPTEAMNLKDDPNLTIRLTPSPAVGELILNCKDPLLRDVRLRRALAYAIDRATIAKQVSYGYFDPRLVAAAFFGWAYDPTVQQISFDKKRADALLDSLGWKRGPNGMRERNGQPLQLDLISSSHGNDGNVDVLIQNQLAGIGIAVAIRPLDPSTFMDQVFLHSKFQMSYMMWAFQGWDGDLSPLACDQGAPEGGNFGHFCDARFDAAVRAGYSTFDPAKRRAAYAIAQRVFYEQVPQILLWGQPAIDIYSKRLQNFVDDDGSVFHHANAWSLVPPRP